MPERKNVRGGTGSSARSRREGGSSSGKAKPRSGGGNKQKVNPAALGMLIGTPVLLIIAAALFFLKPGPITETVRHDPGKVWKDAAKIGQEGLRLYQDGQNAKQKGNAEEQKKKFQEAYDMLSKALDKGSDAVYHGLCVDLNLEKDVSDKYIKEFLSEDRFESFDEFLIEQKVIDGNGNQKDVIGKWKKGTGGYQETMSNWAAKRYDINKNIRLEKND